MKLPEQLPLDFSTHADDLVDQQSVGAEVHYLAEYRILKDAQRMLDIYDAIFESIKHIDVRRRVSSAVHDSKFG